MWNAWMRSVGLHGYETRVGVVEQSHAMARSSALFVSSTTRRVSAAVTISSAARPAHAPVPAAAAMAGARAGGRVTWPYGA